MQDWSLVEAYLIAEWLSSACQHPSLSIEKKESLEVALQCLTDTFHLNLSSDSSQGSITRASLPLPASVTLSSLVRKALDSHAAANPSESTDEFQKFITTLTQKGFFKGVEPGTVEYEDRLEKARSKWTASRGSDASPSAAMPSATPVQSGDAETLKAEGNTLLSSHDYQGAVAKYSAAIALIPNNAIYYSNRAAALTQLNRLRDAIDDCDMAIQIDPNYAKAYSRKGLAQYKMKDYEGATATYKSGLLLEPSNASMKEGLDAATSAMAPASGPAGGMPGLGGGMPGLGGLAGLLNNPMISQMMQDPSIQAMMKDPKMMQDMLKNMGGMEGLAGMMGGMGGGMGGGGGAGSSSVEHIEDSDL